MSGARVRWWVGIPWWLAGFLGLFVVAGYVAYWTLRLLIWAFVGAVVVVLVMLGVGRELWRSWRAKKASK